MSDDEHADHGLVMPFVVCASQGGPYDDEAFVAGFKAGEIWRQLEANPHRMDDTIRTELVPQVDLIAMHFGYRMDAEPWDEHPEDWSYVTFIKIPPSTL